MKNILFLLSVTLFLTSCDEIKTTESIEEEYTKYNVLIFLTDSCEVNRYYLPEINRISSSFEKDPDLSFYAIYPVSEITMEEFSTVSKDTLVDIAAYYDTEMKLTKQYKVLVAPSAFIVDKEGKLLYGGAIDDKYDAIKKPKIMVRQRNLEDNIKSLSSGAGLVYPSTPAVGCFINRE
jgi:hypothetical protein